MKWMLYLLLILFSGCAVTITPLPAHKPIVHHKHKKVKYAKLRPAQTPVPKMPETPPFPPPNWDEVVRRTHPTPTISPYDFQ